MAEEQSTETEIEMKLDDTEQDTLASYIKNKYESSSDSRYSQEARWMDSYRNYRGIYGAETQFTETEKSQVFLKVTKTKVTAAYGQIIDVLFAGQKFPLGVEATRVPSGVEEAVHFDPKNPTAPEEDPNQGSLFPPGSKEEELELGALKDLADDLELKEGAGVTPTSITYHPAEEAARTMEKKILDQLEESSASIILQKKQHVLWKKRY